MTAKEFLRNMDINSVSLNGSKFYIRESLEKAIIEFAEHRISEIKNQILKEVYNNTEYLQTLEIDEFECITIENLEIILNNIK